MTPFAYAHHEKAQTQHISAENIDTMRTQYDAIRLDTSDKNAQLKKLTSLIQQASTKKTPDYMALRGAMMAYQASLIGGLQGLSIAKQARKLLEESIHTEENVLDGYALLCLGALYYRIPGWPIGFRDTDKARTLLLKAIQLNPMALDPYVFYAEFLVNQRHPDIAIQQLKKGLELAPPHTRIPAYQARRHEAESLLKQLKTQYTKN